MGRLAAALAGITDYAVEVRYPGRAASVIEVRGILRQTRRIRPVIRERLGLL